MGRNGEVECYPVESISFAMVRFPPSRFFLSVRNNQIDCPVSTRSK